VPAGILIFSEEAARGGAAGGAGATGGGAAVCGPSGCCARPSCGSARTLATANKDKGIAQRGISFITMSLRLLGAMRQAKYWMHEYIACVPGPRGEFGPLTVTAKARQFVLVDAADGN
jgi:hypothetical protein